MQVHRGLDHLPVFHNAVLTIGSFDGVHHGHRMIISSLIAKAKEVKGESIILTFDPHPRQVVFPNDTSLRLLSTLEEKIELLNETDLDHLVIIPFTIEFSQINPYLYVDELLIGKINVNHLIIGYDHKFGLNREGDIDLLNIYARQEKFTVQEILKQDVDNLHVSSTKIRNHLLNGDIEKANKLLGASYQISGKVTKGSQIAGSLGYPTANCEIKNKSKLIPVPGTYAARAMCNGKGYVGMLYIGKSPTLQNLNRDVIEMNLFGTVNESLYGQRISIFPEKQFRKDEKFKSRDELKYNIAQDKIEVEHYFQHIEQNKIVASAILNYNGEKHLKTYLRSHVPTANHEVIVIDNASSDNSVQFIVNHNNDVKLIQLDSNGGFAKGYNDGLKITGYKYTAIVNSDIRVSENWLAPIIEVMESDSSIAAVQPKILSDHKTDEFEYAGASGGFIDLLGYPFCRGRMMNYVENDEGQYNDKLEVFWTSGAAMVIRTDLFKKAGGFDVKFFAHMEEIDLCWRIRKCGYRFLCVPQSVVYHLGGGTLDYNNPKKVYLNLRNSYWMILKNYSMLTLFLVIPLRVFIDLAYVLLFLVQRKLNNFAMGIKGITEGLLGILTISKKRKELKFFIKRYKIQSPSNFGKKNIIMPFSFFILGKKRFSSYK